VDKARDVGLAGQVVLEDQAGYSGLFGQADRAIQVGQIVPSVYVRYAGLAGQAGHIVPSDQAGCPGLVGQADGIVPADQTGYAGLACQAD